eukprot:m.134273 g.134273  ORF g.134273 m.134273 type:complete len:68 (-) comp14690_c0_seq7:173-376(-)
MILEFWPPVLLEKLKFHIKIQWKQSRAKRIQGYHKSQVPENGSTGGTSCPTTRVNRGTPPSAVSPAR